jgi:hypothetical protein
MFHAVHDAHKARAIGRRDGYRRREPRTTVLYQTVAEHWPVFRERAEESGGLARFVEREFEVNRPGFSDDSFT